MKGKSGMCKTLCVVVRQPPYGRLAAAEAVRHLAGALASGLRAVGLLVDDGVYLAKAGQLPVAGGWTDLSRALADLLAQSSAAPDGTARRVDLWVHGPSLRSRGLGAADLVAGCTVVDDAEAAAIVGRADATLVY